jgi:hypothetical protein
VQLQIDHRHLARLLGMGRVAIGAALLAAPGRFGRRWLGDTATRRSTKVAVRALGARDVVVGMGTLRALGTGDPALRQWVTWAGLCDLTDATATILAYPALPKRNRALTLAIAAGAAGAAFAAREHLE